MRECPNTAASSRRTDGVSLALTQFDVSTSLIYQWRRNAQQCETMFVPAVMAEDEGPVAAAASGDGRADSPARPGWGDDGEHCGDGARWVGPGGATGIAMIPVRSDLRYARSAVLSWWTNPRG
jgi:hypothetical protein